MNYKNNNDYIFLINDILNSKEFNKLKSIVHHGTTRYTHSIRVSYLSYKIAHLLKLNYKSVAKAGLLHDFFLSDVGRSSKSRVLSTFTHPKKASQNAKDYFGITEKEKNIIESHMFPFCLTLPIYSESWVVILSDKLIGVCEFIINISKNLRHVINFSSFVLLTLIK